MGYVATIISIFLHSDDIVLMVIIFCVVYWISLLTFDALFLLQVTFNFSNFYIHYLLLYSSIVRITLIKFHDSYNKFKVL